MGTPQYDQAAAEVMSRGDPAEAKALWRVAAISYYCLDDPLMGDLAFDRLERWLMAAGVVEYHDGIELKHIDLCDKGVELLEALQDCAVGCPYDPDPEI
jgi:hypothetical protein